MAIELLAVAAINLIAPYFVKAGEAAAEKAGEGAAIAAGKVLGWIRTRLGGDARDALKQVEANPGSEGRKAVLKEELVRALEANPKLVDELRTLIPQEMMQSVTMTQTIRGDNAKGAQIHGSQNEVDM